MSRSQVVVVLIGFGLSSAAFAHGISWQIVWLFVGAPLFAVVLTISASIVARSWKVAILGLGIVGFWVTWYSVVAKFSEIDILFWIPLVAVNIQVAALLAWLVWKLAKRVRV